MRVFLLPAGIHRNFDAYARRDLANCFVEGQSLTLHQEAECVTRFAAAETLVETFCGDDVEGRSFFVVEGAQSAEFLAGPFERHVLTDHLDQVNASAHLVNNVIWYHSSSATVTPEPPSPIPPCLNLLTRRSARSSSVTTCRNAPVPLPWMIRREARSACTAASTAG